MAHKHSDPNIFILPDLGEGVHEAELIKWRVQTGQAVKEHEILAEMETDKALVEVPSPRAGTIKILHGAEGEILHVGNPLVTYEGGAAGKPAGEGATEKARGAGGGSKHNGSTEREDAGTVVGKVGDATPGIGRGDGKALAAPAVRRLARDLGVEINSVVGTGIAGRVTAKDVRDAAEGRSAPKAAPGKAPEPARPAPSAPAPEVRRPLAPPSYGAPATPYPQPAPPQPYAPPAAMPGHAYPPAYAPAYPPYPPHYPPYAYAYPPPPYYPAPYPPPYAPYPPYPAAGGVPMSPGFVPAPGSRPVPDPAQRSCVEPGRADGRVPFRGVRRTIAERLRESVNTAVHFTVVDEADVTALDDLRRRHAEQTGQKISFLPFVCAAVCRAISPLAGGRFGAMNARVDDDAGEVVQYAATHLGIAADTDSGLMVPVVRDAQAMDIARLSAEIAAIAKAARERTIPRDRLMGSTFTISNVGSHAGRFATPVINYPEVGILAVGKVYDGVVVRDGQAVVGKIMPLSLACDHRVVDGATAALALAEIVRLLSVGCVSLV
jgi:pyruvate dehydrogenase E2 component (dihydrolipoamide acetyltransferase)